MVHGTPAALVRSWRSYLEKLYAPELSPRTYCICQLFRSGFYPRNIVSALSIRARAGAGEMAEHTRLVDEGERHEPSLDVRLKSVKLISRLKRMTAATKLRGVTRPPFIVLNTDTWKIYWDLLVTVVIIYSAVQVPVQLSFSQTDGPSWLWWLSLLISLIFLADCSLTFCTAYLDGGVWVTSHAAIARRYCGGWFWIDAPSAVPLELIELALPTLHDERLGMFRLLRMLRLLRLLRLLKIDYYVRRLEEYLEDSLELDIRVLRIAKLIAKLLLLSHFLGCGWMAVATSAIGHGVEHTWLSEYNNGVAIDGPFAQQYLYAFHWAATMLVGHDADITPVTDAERRYATMAALLSALVFGYIVGESAHATASARPYRPPLPAAPICPPIHALPAAPSHDLSPHASTLRAFVPPLCFHSRRAHSVVATKPLYMRRIFDHPMAHLPVDLTCVCCA